MEKNNMTLAQFLTVLVASAILLFFLGFEIYGHLHVGGENIYEVRSYSALSRALSQTEGPLLPEKSALPAHDDANYFVITTSHYKLTQPKDGYYISLRDSKLDYVIRCAREGTPPFADDIPLRSDRTLGNTELELNADSKSVNVSFLHNGFYYRLVVACPHGEILSDPSGSLDSLLNITENILQQAG